MNLVHPPWNRLKLMLGFLLFCCLGFILLDKQAEASLLQPGPQQKYLEWLMKDQFGSVQQAIFNQQRPVMQIKAHIPGNSALRKILKDVRMAIRMPYLYLSLVPMQTEVPCQIYQALGDMSSSVKREDIYQNPDNCEVHLRFHLLEELKAVNEPGFSPANASEENIRKGYNIINLAWRLENISLNNQLFLMINLGQSYQSASTACLVDTREASIVNQWTNLFQQDPYFFICAVIHNRPVLESTIKDIWLSVQNDIMTFEFEDKDPNKPKAQYQINLRASSQDTIGELVYTLQNMKLETTKQVTIPPIPEDSCELSRYHYSMLFENTIPEELQPKQVEALDHHYLFLIHYPVIDKMIRSYTIWPLAKTSIKDRYAQLNYVGQCDF